MTLTAGNREPIVRVSGITKHFGATPVLRGMDLTLGRGELLTIIGPSGCGKSTFLRCLNGLETPDAGHIDIAGVSLLRRNVHEPISPKHEAEAHRLRERVGMLFQALNLFPHLTVMQNVMLAPMVVKGEAKGTAAARADALLTKVGLRSLGDRYPHHLSGGQQQRAAIARALAMSPEVMLYDEPTSALDPELVDEVLEVMRGLHAEGMTQIVVTHEMRFASEASDFIVYMEDGVIVEQGARDSLFKAPQDERTRRFLKRYVGLSA